MIDPKDTEIAALKLALEVARAQQAKTEELYVKLADAYEALLKSHRALDLFLHPK